jgi:hypothetical protein
MSIEATAVNDYYELTSSLPNSASDVTVMMWVYIPGGTFNYMCGLSNATNIQWYWLGEPASPRQLSIGITGGGSVALESPTTINTWRGVAFTITSGGSIKVYLEGTPGDGGPVTITGTPTALRVGYSVNGGELVTGTRMYGLKIWNRQLSDAEIVTENGSYSPVSTSSLYGAWLLSSASATISDTSGNGHTLTRSGSSFTTAADPPAKGATWPGGTLKEYNGASWVRVKLKDYETNTWVSSRGLKRWDGSQWLLVNTTGR